MITPLLNELIEKAETLPPDEQRRLVTHLVDKAFQQLPAAPPRYRKWREIRGMLPYPALGEDAQAWVTRTRREGDEHRERLLRGEE